MLFNENPGYYILSKKVELKTRKIKHFLTVLYLKTITLY